MGYESRFIVGVAHKDEGHGGVPKRWVSPIADFHLGKISYDSRLHDDGSLLKAYPTNQGYFFYADDGDTEVHEDCYGDPLRELDIETFITVMSEDYNNEITQKPGLVALLAALQMLQNFRHIYDIPDLDRKLVLLHYGY